MRESGATRPLCVNDARPTAGWASRLPTVATIPIGVITPASVVPLCAAPVSAIQAVITIAPGQRGIGAVGNPRDALGIIVNEGHRFDPAHLALIAVGVVQAYLRAAIAPSPASHRTKGLVGRRRQDRCRVHRDARDLVIGVGCRSPSGPRASSSAVRSPLL